MPEEHHGSRDARPTETFFLRTGRFTTYEEVTSYIDEERKHKKETFKNLAKIARSFEGAVSYDSIKRMPNWEVELLIKAIEEVHQEEERAMKAAQRSNKIGF